MKIVTTPMCEKILEFAGISEYKVNKDPDKEEGDLAILLSENKVKMNSLNIKLNTFLQIKDSIIEVSKIRGNFREDETLTNDSILQHIDDIFSQYSLANKWISDEKESLQEKNSKIKVKVYSNFLKDIIEDMGFSIIDHEDNSSQFDYIVLPDYMSFDDINEEDNRDYKIITIPTHKNVSNDSIKRAELRYSILGNLSQ